MNSVRITIVTMEPTPGFSTSGCSFPRWRSRSAADLLADRHAVAVAVDAMRDYRPAVACAGIVAAPVMAVMPIVAVAGANCNADILRLGGSSAANSSKAENGGGDCNVFHAYPPNASCGRQNDLARFRFHCVILRRCRRNAERSNALICGPWNLPSVAEGRGLRAGSVP